MSIAEKVEYMRQLIADLKYKADRGLLTEEEKIEYQTLSRYMEGFQDGNVWCMSMAADDNRDIAQLRLDLKEALDRIAELEALLKDKK